MPLPRLTSLKPALLGLLIGLGAILALPSSAFIAGALIPEAVAGPASAFTLRDLKGATHTLSQYKGKVVVLSFWATWCGPCKVEMPHLQKLHEELAAQGLVMLGINSDDAKSAAKVGPVVTSLGVSYPTLLDSSTQVVAVYNPAKTLPYTAVIDRKGELVYTHAGYNAGDEVVLREKLVELLKQAP